ncbi:MAG: hypothetical protein IKZ08_03090 [Bacteroidales bacterium]|nr:hypothetical protein [Bacteroidales bacterium]
MEKRKMLFGSYDTALNGLWTLTEWELTDPEYKQNFLDIPGRNGPLDLSAVLTNGEPVYGARTLTAVFESSEGTRLERKSRIDNMVNWLTGWRMDIELPDDTQHYITGRVQVQRLYNDMAHGSVQVTAVCDPWRYNKAETVVELTAKANTQTATLVNHGRRTVVPLLTIAGDEAEVLLVFGASSWALGPGTYQLPDIELKQGSAELTYSGSGTLTFTYREAVL